MKKTLLRSGSSYSIYELSDGNEHFVTDYINTLGEEFKKQVYALLKYIIDHGIPTNIEKFRKVGDCIFELKTRSGIRILCFFHGEGELVLTHGFRKPKGKVLRTEIDRAKRLREELINST